MADEPAPAEAAAIPTVAEHLPCPFCGSGTLMPYRPSTVEYHRRRIMCEDCGAVGPYAEEGEMAAWSRWDTRARVM